MTDDEQRVMDGAIDVVRDYLRADATPRPPVDDVEATRLYIEQMAQSVRRVLVGPAEKLAVAKVICAEVTRPLAEASFDGPIEIDETMAPGAISVVPFAYARNITATIGFINPPEGT